MANERHSQYKGCSITTRWQESGLPDAELPRRFTASFSVDSPEAHDSAWQQFPEEEFATSVGAADNALEAAKNSIDRSISDKPFCRRGGSA
ncbi:MAG: hypothetical protein V4569_06400 [Pseudomonadota bacterium]